MFFKKIQGAKVLQDNTLGGQNVFFLLLLINIYHKLIFFFSKMYFVTFNHFKEGENFKNFKKIKSFQLNVLN